MSEPNRLSSHPLRLFPVLVSLTVACASMLADDCGFGPKGFDGKHLGKTFLDFRPGNEKVTSILVQPDQKILVGSTSQDDATKMN